MKLISSKFPHPLRHPPRPSRLSHRPLYLHPTLVGTALLIAGTGYVADGAGTYILPDADLPWLQITFVFELVFVLWLWILGWRLPEQTPPAATTSL